MWIQFWLMFHWILNLVACWLAKDWLINLCFQRSEYCRCSLSVQFSCSPYKQVSSCSPKTHFVFCIACHSPRNPMDGCFLIFVVFYFSICRIFVVLFIQFFWWFPDFCTIYFLLFWKLLLLPVYSCSTDTRDRSVNPWTEHGELPDCTIGGASH